MTLEPFEPRHLTEIQMQPVQAQSWARYGSVQYAEEIARGVLAYSVRADGVLMGCGGIKEQTPEIGHLWSFISVNAGPHLISMHRIARRMIEVSGKRVMVATSEKSFLNGCRWLQMLGFMAIEALPGYGIDGSDHILYMRNV